MSTWESRRPPLRFSGPPPAARAVPDGGVVGASRFTSAQVEDDGLELGESLHRVAPPDAAHAGHRPSPPAEGEVALPVVRGGVYVDPSGSHSLGEGAAPPRAARA